ncbi:MAG: sulfatase-like hydrolase/transferase [Kiritimatiellae bacterium]|nr:sulfatase-like hydrolase/transferase [Kiritimatiellia bacterium]
MHAALFNPTASNTPFRYHKSWVHEGGISSPLIVHWPDGIRARGELRHTPSHFVDIVPTLLEWAGQTTDPDWKGQDSPPLAGVSLVRAIRENCEAKRDFIFFRHIGHRALRMGRWKLVAVHHGKWELYDMESDRSELCNLADKHPERVRRMAGIWERAHETFIAQSGETRD